MELVETLERILILSYINLPWERLEIYEPKKIIYRAWLNNMLLLSLTVTDHNTIKRMWLAEILFKESPAVISAKFQTLPEAIDFLKVQLATLAFEISKAIPYPNGLISSFEIERKLDL